MKLNIKYCINIYFIIMLCTINLSCSKDEDEIDTNITETTTTQNNTSGNTSSDHAIDLGLSVLWADVNIGANKPEEYGDYFSWGETTVKKTYGWSTYKWGNGLLPQMKYSKYCISSNNGTVDNRTQLEPEDDAAIVNWGGKWRMPTAAEMNEILTKCTWTWTTLNGVYGELGVGPNGNTIFFPSAGWCDEERIYHTDTDGYYWSSSLSKEHSGFAVVLDFYYLGIFSNENGGKHRYVGCPIRPVCPK